MESVAVGALFSFDMIVKLRLSGFLGDGDFRNQMSQYGVLVVWDDVSLDV